MDICLPIEGVRPSTQCPEAWIHGAAPFRVGVGRGTGCGGSSTESMTWITPLEGHATPIKRNLPSPTKPEEAGLPKIRLKPVMGLTCRKLPHGSSRQQPSSLCVRTPDGDRSEPSTTPTTENYTLHRGRSLHPLTESFRQD